MNRSQLSRALRWLVLAAFFVPAFAAACTAVSCIFPSPDDFCTSHPHGFPFWAIGPFCECNAHNGGRWVSYTGLALDICFYGFFGAVGFAVAVPLLPAFPAQRYRA